MSHIVEIRTQVRDAAAVRKACERLKLEQPVQRTFKLFSGKVTGLGVKLPEWRYPLVCQLETGNLQYDNYNGRWGEQVRLDQFLQAYGVEMTRLAARRKGHSVTEQQLQDGSKTMLLLATGTKPAKHGSTEDPLRKLRASEIGLSQHDQRKAKITELILTACQELPEKRISLNDLHRELAGLSETQTVKIIVKEGVDEEKLKEVLESNGIPVKYIEMSHE